MITFNGISSDGFADIIAVQRISRPLWAGATLHTLNFAGADGIYYFGKDRKEKNIGFRLILKSSTIEARRVAIRNIAAWLNTDNPAPLSFSDEPHLIYYAVLAATVPVEETALLGYADINFFVPDGCAYGATPKTEGAVGTVYYNNQGNLAVPVIADIIIKNIPATEMILNLTDHVYVRIIQPLAANDVIKVDTQRGETLINNINADKNITYNSSPFFKLPPGLGRLVVTPATSEITIIFREGYV